MDSKGLARSGVGFGTALAIAISWSLHQSVFWAILHGVFSWVYVICWRMTPERLKLLRLKSYVSIK